MRSIIIIIIIILMERKRMETLKNNQRVSLRMRRRKLRLHHRLLRR
jgi:hypothetical protein